MSRNFFKSRNKLLRVVAVSGWVFAGFIFSQLILLGFIKAYIGLGFNFGGINQSVLSFAVAAITYTLTLAITIGLPWLLFKSRTSKAELGMSRLVSWFDILVAPVGFIGYIIISGAILYFVAQFVPGFNVNQVQDIGFSRLSSQSDYILAFLTLIVIAPIVEEILMRGYLYGKLRKSNSMWLAAIVTSLVFGLLHGQWNVGLDVFALSLVLCGLRELTGSIWAGVLVHMIKNGLAFYVIFINPAFLTTIGG